MEKTMEELIAENRALREQIEAMKEFAKRIVSLKAITG